MIEFENVIPQQEIIPVRVSLTHISWQKGTSTRNYCTICQ